MIRTLLVPLTGDGSDVALLSAAAVVAGAFNAHVDALHLRFDAAAAARAAGARRGIRGIRGRVVNDLVHHLEQDASAREAKAHAVFTEFCTRELLPAVRKPQNTDIKPSAQWQVESDQEPHLLAAYGMSADLIVASRGVHGDDGSARFILNTLLIGSGRPVLIPGGQAVPSNLSERIVIAWKPTPEAARAVAFAMPFISRAKEVMVLTIDEQQEEIPEGGRLTSFLAWHGVQATTQRLKRDSAGAAATTLAAAEKASLLVMGGYGHARLTEWAFGGFTRSILREAPLPVLMAH